MPELTLDALENVFREVVNAMEKDEFDSHEFILRLAHDHQRLYINALAVYADTDRPSQVVHGEVARRLLNYGDLVVKTGETFSNDIFGQSNSCTTWHRVG
ncbi:MAG TPA: hypothetical protein VMY80_11785 [Anaerolineae bacterium]|nr:hypothetical protein [Anaerolineae bacterium]